MLSSYLLPESDVDDFLIHSLLFPTAEFVEAIHLVLSEVQTCLMTMYGS